MNNNENREYNEEEKNRIQIQYSLEKLIEKLETPLARREHRRVMFYYCKEGEDEPTERSNIAVLEVDKDGKDEVTLSIGVCRRGTDRLVSNYLFEAGKTQEEVCAWMKNTEVCIPVIWKSEKHLSESVDEYWD